MFILDTDITTFSKLVRQFFAMIDGAVYSLIAVVYNLIEDLANVSILSMSNMDEFAGRIYSLLGLFMLFKVSFSIISYIISPDKMNDTAKGMTGIIKNVVITLVLIISVPTAFNLLYEAQSAILSENTIPRFLLGSDDNKYTISGNGSEQIKFSISPVCSAMNEKDKGLKLPTTKNRGTEIALLTFRNFYQAINWGDKNDRETENADFVAVYCAFGMENITVPYYLQGAILIYPEEDEISKILDDNSKLKKIAENLTKNIVSFEIGNLTSGLGILGLVGKAVFKKVTSPTTYNIDYSILVSTLCGIFVLLILISMAFDIAVRSIKLTFLQLISPIPIISYVDPKSGKDGMFKRWYTEVFKTWASLFIRLAAIFFGVYLIQQLDGLYSLDPDHEFLSGNFWIQLFMLIGILMFAKQLPKLLESLIPGMSGAGTFNLNPFKKLKNEMPGATLVGKTAGAVGVGTAALAGAGITHAVARGRLKNNIAKQNTKYKDARHDAIQTKLNTTRQIRANDGKISNLNANRAKVLDDYQRGKIDKETKDKVIGNIDGKISNLNANNTKLNAQRVDASEKAVAEKQKLEELRNTRLYKRPVTGYMGSLSRGALYGLQQGYKNPKRIFKGTLDSVQKASSMRNYRDQYSIKDQVMDKLTDIAGIKNTSGTTSKTKEQITTATLALNETQRNIEMLNRSISNLADKMGSDFNSAIAYDANNRMVFNSRYTGAFADELSGLLTNYNNQVDMKNNLEKRIRDLENIKNTEVPGSKK